ncbi:MAG: glycosyltransferase [Acidimicrobiales bacterium]
MTVLIPTVDEQVTVGACIAAVGRQDIGVDQLEVVVVDGSRDERTRVSASEALRGTGITCWTILENPGGSRPANLNLGLAAASCDVVCRVDARSRIPVHYVSRCARILAERPDVSVVGGRQRAVAANAGMVGRGVARALNNRWAMGGARYRRSGTAGPAETVYLGAFRTDQLQAVGGWDAKLLVNEDFDLNRRMANAGTVWFEPSLEVGYCPRPSLRALAAQYGDFGRWKVRYWRSSGDRPHARQYVGALGVPAAAAVAIASLAWEPTRKPAFVGALALATAVEVRGPLVGPGGGLGTHAVSAVASAVMVGAWVAGIWAEMLHRSSL